MEHNNFKLCGGTLFALLTNAKLNKKKSTFDKKGYSEEELMLDLVKIYYPSAHNGDSFKKDTNKFYNEIKKFKRNLELFYYLIFLIPISPTV